MPIHFNSRCRFVDARRLVIAAICLAIAVFWLAHAAPLFGS